MTDYDRISLEIQKLMFETEMRISAMDSRVAELEEIIEALRLKIRKLEKSDFL